MRSGFFREEAGESEDRRHECGCKLGGRAGFLLLLRVGGDGLSDSAGSLHGSGDRALVIARSPLAGNGGGFGGGGLDDAHQFLKGLQIECHVCSSLSDVVVSSNAGGRRYGLKLLSGRR